MGTPQLTFAFSPLRNSELFSNHWLEHRLPLEPEWSELADRAHDALESLTTLWKAERHRVHKYTKEAPLEKGLHPARL